MFYTCDNSDKGTSLSLCFLRFRHLELSQHPRRISGHHDKVRDVLRHHTPRADRDASPDSHARKHDDVSSEPAVLPDLYGLSSFGPSGSVPQEGIQRMVSAIERAVWADECTCADINCARVYPSAAGVDINSFP